MNASLRALAGVGVSVAILAARPAPAIGGEPYLSVRTGFRCSQCHVNRTGGGGRTDFGSLYAQTKLPMRAAGFRGRSVSPLLAAGADLRVLATGVAREATPRTALELEEANLYVEARLIRSVLALYVDELVGPTGAVTREAFALVQGLPLTGYLKVGKFFLPYGLRLLDDAEFVREATGFTFDTPDQGVEVGVEPGPLSVSVAVSNGTQGAAESNSGKQLTGSLVLLGPVGRLGASASRNDAAAGRRDVVGAFAGFRAGRVTVLGEVDLIRDEPPSSPALEQLAAYVEGDVLVARGLNLKATHGFLDPDRSIGENARTRSRVGLEWFPMPFFQVSAFYVLLRDIPQATSDLDRVTIQLHAFF